MEGVEDTNTNLYPFNIINHTQGVKKIYLYFLILPYIYRCARSFLILYTGVYTIVVGNLRIRTPYTYYLPDKILTSTSRKPNYRRHLESILFNNMDYGCRGTTKSSID